MRTCVKLYLSWGCCDDPERERERERTNSTEQLITTVTWEREEEENSVRKKVRGKKVREKERGKKIITPAESQFSLMILSW